MGEGAVTEELKQIYEEANDDGIWLMEFGKNEASGLYFAAAGSIKKAKSCGSEVWEAVENYKLSLGDCMDLGALPGLGKTREEACRQAIKKFKEFYKK